MSSWATNHQTHHNRQHTEMLSELQEAVGLVSQMPAVLWAAGPTVRVVDYERREPSSYFGEAYLVYVLEVE
eukprot:COSAG01_NODE_7822_length_3041_cov_105.161115_2_plen_71_part_00